MFEAPRGVRPDGKPLANYMSSADFVSRTTGLQLNYSPSANFDNAAAIS